MNIKNINGKSQCTCRCGSWLKHWEIFSGQRTTTCQVNGCWRNGVVGAHVQKARSADERWYIFPLCEAHSQNAGVLDVSDIYRLVPANPEETCGRKIGSHFIRVRTHKKNRLNPLGDPVTLKK